ncbi:MAG: hypothetical protein WAW88_09575 [Nocardioides sp.]
MPLHLKQVAAKLHGVDELEDWCRSVQLWLWEEVQSNLRFRASRRRVDDYIELRKPGWPQIPDFTFEVIESRPGPASAMKFEGRLRAAMARDGLDAEAALQSCRSAPLSAWVVGYADNETALPFMTQAVTIWDGNGPAELVFTERAPGSKVTQLIETIRAVLHVSADAGVLSVCTRLEVPHYPILGFERNVDGSLSVETTFLQSDPSSVEQLLKSGL